MDLPPILNPSIPYLGSIGDEGSFFPNKLIRIQGTIPEVSFNINLQCGSEFVQDIALQISVNILNRFISLNSTKHQEWNKEILKSLDSIYYSIPGEKFDIVVLCQFDHYKLIIDGQQFCNFPHRLPYYSVSHLSIDGDVSISRISFEAECAYKFWPPSRRLLSSPVNEPEHIEPLLLPNNVNINSTLPPPYESIIKNNCEDVKLHPEQPMHAEHVVEYRAQPSSVISNCCFNFSFRIFFSAVALLILLIVTVLKKINHEDSSSTSYRVLPFRIRRLG